MTTDTNHPGDAPLTPEQLDLVSAGGIDGTDYWIRGEVGGRVWVHDGDGNCVGEFASITEAYRWILGGDAQGLRGG